METTNIISFTNCRFFLMADGLLRSCGCSRLTVKLAPLITAHKFLALKIDVSSLFALFCSRKKAGRGKEMEFANNDGSLITT